MQIHLLDPWVIRMQLLSEQEVEDVLCCASSSDAPSPFYSIERWMELLGPPPTPSWIRVRGVPLHAWQADVVRLIGDSVGHTIEIEDRIASKEIMKEGRIKVMLDRAVTLPMSLPLWVEDLRFQIQNEKDPDDRDSFPGLEHSDKGKILHYHKTRKGDQRRMDREVEDDDDTALDLDFKLPASCATSGDELVGQRLNRPIVGHMGGPKMQAGQGDILLGESPQK